MDHMLEAFIQESKENLEAAGVCFLQLEKKPSNTEVINDLFRSIHTIKGSSGLFDIVPLTRVVHAAEDALDAARESSFDFTPPSINLFLESLDQVGIWIDVLETTGELPETAEADGQILAGRLRALLDAQNSCEETTKYRAKVDDSAMETHSIPAPQWLKQVDHSARLECFTKARDDVLAIVYTPREDCFFVGDDPILTVQGLPGLKWFSIQNNKPWGDQETLDPSQCNLSFSCLVNATIMEARNYLKLVAEQVDFIKLEATQLIVPVGRFGDNVVYEALLGEATKALEEGRYECLKLSLKPLLEIGSAELIQTSVLAWLDILLSQPEPAKPWLKALLKVLQTGVFTPPDINRDGVANATKTIAAEPDNVTASVLTQKPFFSENIPVATRHIFETQLHILAMPCAKFQINPRVLSTVNLLVKAFNQISWQSLVPQLEIVGQQSLAELSCQPLHRYLTQCVTGSITATAGAELFVSQDDVVHKKRQKISDFTQNFFTVQLKLLEMQHSEKLLMGIVASTLTLLERVFTQLDWTDSIASLKSAAAASTAQISSQPLADSLRQCLYTNLGCKILGDEKVITATKIIASEYEGVVPSVGDRYSELTATIDRHDANTNIDLAADKELGSTGNAKFLRVDQERIDRLMDLVGELVVAKNSLPFLARRAEQEFNAKALSKEIKSQYEVINRLSQELQHVAISVRMVSVSSVFKRFPRLVRDLSQRLGKNIELITEGEDTEADKSVIENLADPLLHLVRNSLDHGIEMPARRLALGKPENATLVLRAASEDDQLIIEIIDDGKGIDPLIIKEKAYEKGIINEAQLKHISDQEAIELIFTAGLSSKDDANDLSGRGVGMDVVCNAVNLAGGSVSVFSQVNVGSTVTLRLPLSMAVAQVMMIEVDRQVYGVAMDMISETVRVPVELIKRVKHSEAIVLRDKLIPLRRLRDLLGLPQAVPAVKEEAILIVTLFGEDMGLIIDEFHAGIDVIQKPLEGVMSLYSIYAGTTLLGDGRVLLILDLKELMRCL